MAKSEISQHGRYRAAGETKQLLHLLHRSRKNTHPFTAFLELRDDSDSRLWRVARQTSSQPFDLNSFRAEFLSKLRRVPYSQPRDPNRDKKTFYEVLKRYKALPVCLRRSTLRAIGRWLLLRDTIRTDRELELKNQSVEHFPLRFHSAITSELSRHERKIFAAMSKFKVEEQWMSEYLSAVNREKMRQLRIISLSRWPGSREPLLEKHHDEELLQLEYSTC